MPRYPGGRGGEEGLNLPGTLIQALQLRQALERMAYEPEAAALRYQGSLPQLLQMEATEETPPEYGAPGSAQARYLQFHGIPETRAGKVRKRYLADKATEATDALRKLEESFAAQQDQAIDTLNRLGTRPGIDPRESWMDAASKLARHREGMLRGWRQTYQPVLRDPEVKSHWSDVNALFGRQGTDYTMTGLMLQALGRGPQLPGELVPGRSEETVHPPGSPEAAFEERLGRGMVGATRQDLPLFRALQGMRGPYQR